MSFENEDGMLLRYTSEKGEKEVVIREGITKISFSAFARSNITGDAARMATLMRLILSK